jgi:quinoprotein glucose dehydrogenase
LVVAEAASAIQDDESIPAALPALARILESPAGAHERTLRRALSAAQRLRAPNFAALVARFATDSSQPTPLRLKALAIIKSWPAPPLLDNVEGRPRKLPGIAPATIGPVVRNSLTELSKSADSALAQAAWEAVAIYGISQDPSELLTVVEQDTPVAAEALKLLAQTDSATYALAARRAIGSQHDQVRATALRAMVGISLPEFLQAATRALSSGDLILSRTAIELLQDRSDEDSMNLLLSILAQLRAGSLDPALAFDAIQAASTSKNKAVIMALGDYEKTKDSSDPLSPYLETLAGGDVERGGDIFSNSVAVRNYSGGLEGRI